MERGRGKEARPAIMMNMKRPAGRRWCGRVIKLPLLLPLSSIPNRVLVPSRSHPGQLLARVYGQCGQICTWLHTRGRKEEYTGMAVRRGRAGVGGPRRLLIQRGLRVRK